MMNFFFFHAGSEVSSCVIFLNYEYIFFPVLSLEVTLQKRTEGPMWHELVVGDRSGEQLISDEQAALIHQRLAHLTSDELVGAPLPILSDRVTADASVWTRIYK